MQSFSVVPFFDDFWDNFVQVSNDTVVSYAKDRCFGIGVNCNNHTCVLHTCGVVDCTGSAEGNQQLGLNNNAGLTDHLLEGQNATVEDGAGAAQLAAQQVSQFLVLGQLVGAGQAVAQTDYYFFGSQVECAVVFFGDELDQLGADLFQGEVNGFVDFTSGSCGLILAKSEPEKSITWQNKQESKQRQE